MGERRGLTGLVLDFLAATWIAARVVLFVGVTLGIFFVAYLGYFTVPFIFIAVALSLLGMSGGLRQLSRARAWLRSLRGADGQ